MAMALALGRRGQGRTWPNPAVGCVLVRDGLVVGRGWTADGGRPHAEPQALQQAGSKAHGATAYITLEPCAHQGKTPPCAQALIDAGVAEVVAAVGDSDPRVNGAGFSMLREAGVAVTTGICAEEANQDHAGFFLRINEERPFITLKLASSFDGRIATASGESQWITQAPARRAVHALRARHDAVLIGGGTARHDDPTLTVRGLGITHQPVRIVLSQSLNLPINNALEGTLDVAPLWLCHGANVSEKRQAHWQKAGAELIACRTDQGALAIADALKNLANRGLTRILCEGGGMLAASLLALNLVDEIVGFQAGITIGAEGQPNVGLLGLKHLNDANRFGLVRTTAIGSDVMTVWRRSNRQAKVQS